MLEFETGRRSNISDPLERRLVWVDATTVVITGKKNGKNILDVIMEISLGPLLVNMMMNMMKMKNRRDVYEVYKGDIN